MLLCQSVSLSLSSVSCETSEREVYWTSVLELALKNWGVGLDVEIFGILPID